MKRRVGEEAGTGLTAFSRCPGCWQQEWLAGIAVESHCCAIFSQHSCSADVIGYVGSRQATAGVMAHRTAIIIIVTARALLTHIVYSVCGPADN
jgi:hypothetical protein